MTYWRLQAPHRIPLSGNVATSGTITITPASSGSGPLATNFQLTSSVGGTDVPFTLGHVFKQADVPSGQIANTSDTTNWQCDIRTTWPDGSAKFCVLSGRKTLTAGVAATINLTSAAPAGGTALTTTDLKNTGITASIGCGAFGTVSWATTDWDSPFQTLITGPVMSSWSYRKPVGSDAHLVGWLEVRLYVGGAVEVLAWVENAYLLVASPTSKTETYTFTLGGSQRFSQNFTVYHHTRIPLLSGGARSHWLGTNPDTTVAHNGTYLMATKMLPNMGWTSPSAATLNALTQSYTPNYPGPVGTTMGNAGTRPSLIENEACMYLGAGDARAYKAIVAAGFGQGTWPIHYRDENTNLPFRFSTFPTISLQSGSSPALPTNSGGEAAAYANTHHPNYAYPAAIVTGWNWFVDECLLLNGRNYLEGDQQRRRNDEGIYFAASGGYTERGAAWSLRSLAQALTLCPSSYAHRADLIYQWEQNMIRSKDWYVDGVLYSDQYITNVNFSNSLGVVAPYADYNDTNSRGTAFWHSTWMQSFYVSAVGWAWDMGLPIGATASAAHQSFRDWLYKYPVGLFGDGSSAMNYRWAPAYDFPIKTSKSPGVGYYASFTAAATEWATQTTGEPTSAAEGQTLWYGGGDVVAGDFTTGFTGQKFAALAYAVEHSATGASAAWTRLTRSSSWSLTSNFNDEPKAGVVPRLSYLQQQAVKLGPGQSIRLTTNITGTQLSPEGSDILQWGVSAYYDPVRKEVGFIGKRDGPNPYHWMVLDETRNNWSLDPRALWSSASVSGHGYDHNTCDPATGDVYHVPYGVKVVQKWNGTSWSAMTAWTQNMTATGGLTYFPGLGLFYNDGVALIRFNGTSWDTIATGDNSSYHDFSEYNSTADVLIFGGGNSSGYFKCTRGLTVSSIASAPFRISANAGDQGIIASDPNSDNLIARDVDTGAWAQYDISANAWTTLTQSTGDGSVPQNGTPNLANVNGSEVCCSIPQYGVTIWMQFRSGSSTLDAWLYRHT